MYFKVKPDSCLTWTLVEQSTDETGTILYYVHVRIIIDSARYNYTIVNRPIIDGEDPCEVVDFWGKSKVGILLFIVVQFRIIVIPSLVGMSIFSMNAAF